MEPDLAEIVLHSLGITVADLEAAGADPYDLAPLTAINSPLDFPESMLCDF
jgi:hypothetical protein